MTDQNAEVRSTEINGLTISGYATDYVFQTIEKTGDFYESAILKKWIPFIESCEYIFDIGANLGNHTLYWASHTKYKTICSFEPFEPNFALLKRNVEDNNLADVRPFQCAVGERQGTAAVASFDSDNYGATSFKYSDDEEEGIKVRSVDQILSEENIPRLDFVKIDTEGFELSVLQGMQSALVKYSPLLWVELSPKNVESVYKLLQSNDYHIIDIFGANLLFSKDIEVDGSFLERSLLENCISNLDRLNTYYGNYEKAKGWLNASQQKLENSINEKQKKEKDLQILRGKYETLNTELAETRIIIQTANAELTSAKKEIESTNKELTSTRQDLEDSRSELLCAQNEIRRFNESEIKKNLALCIKANDESTELLIRVQKEIQRLRAQNNYLKVENAGYAAKLAKITGTWYGRLAIKLYHILQKIKRKLYGLKKK